MKIDKYICDRCGCDIENGREYKISIKYPIPESVKVPDRIDRSSRKTTTIELCALCMNQVLGEAVKT